MRSWILGGVASVVLAAASSVAAESISIVSDGSFEVQPASLDGWDGYGPAYDGGTGNASNTFGGWTVASGSVDLVNRYWQAAEGYQSVDMNGNVPGSIYQDLLTQPGKQYVLSFSLAGSPGAIRHLAVSWGGNEVATLQFDARYSTLENMGWETETYLVTATGSNTRLQFTSLDSSQSGAVLDNVSVTAVPVPTTLVGLVGMAFVGALGYLWRRRYER